MSLNEDSRQGKCRMFNATFQLKYKRANHDSLAKSSWVLILGVVCTVLILAQNARTAEIHEADGKTFIVDQKGERWEITQAMSLGFRPEGFQFGMGRDAIRPLKDEDLKSAGLNLTETARVIGIADEGGDEAHAYSVRRLSRHEIANTRLGETPIAAAY